MHAMIIIDEEKMRTHLAKVPNFKCPGPDGIPNSWLKQLHALHPHYARAFNELIQWEQPMDEWFTEGNTFNPDI